MKCMACGSEKDVAVIQLKVGGKVAVCMDCRTQPAQKEVGRPSLGITKKVSLTLSEESWAWFDEQAKGNRSQFLRDLVQHSAENDWSNNACLGYAILGAKKLGYDENQMNQLVRAIYSEFDRKSVEEAIDLYNKSSY